jgi:hypothetical protein
MEGGAVKAIFSLIIVSIMSVRQVQRCDAINANGRRCGRRTGKTNLCYQHLQRDYSVKIKPSGIPGAGMGLFTTVRRNRGSNIAPYTGDLIVGDDDYGGPYVLQVKRNPPTFIDARRSNSGAGRYSNSCRRGQCVNNASLSYSTNTRRASIKANRTILPGREVYTSYGRDYWR